MKRFSQTLAILFLAFLLIGAPIVRAETINVEVSGNGAGSENQANIEVKTETVVQSTNTADIANNVEIDSNTGGNTANGNTGGEVQIQTGDSTTNLDLGNNINNQNLDISSCPGCQSGLNIEISGNGEGSENSVDTQIGNWTNITVENQATVQNSVNVDANTGRNEASGNGGDVRISTGDISVDGGIRNRVNVSSIRVNPQESNGDILIKNTQNGANSVNNINVEIENEVNIEKLNFAVVENDIDIQTNTGGNVADGNLGDIEIETGDISIIFEIINDPINADIVYVGKDPNGCPVDPSDPPEDVIIPPAVLVAAAQVSPSSDSQSSTGGVLGINTLPATGSNFLLLLAGWLLLLFLGRWFQVLGAKQEKKFQYLSASRKKIFRRVSLDK